MDLDREAFRRLRAFEFRCVVPRRIALNQTLVSSQLDRTLTVVFLWIVGIGVVLGVAGFRGQGLGWTLRHLPLTSLAWLLWGIGGLAPMVTAVWAGLTAFLERVTRQTGLFAKPLVELLPLTERQMHAAKFQGRLAGLGVVIAASAVLLTVVRQAMVLLGLVRFPPPLLDPWLVAAVLIYLALFLATAEMARMLRRSRAQTAAALGLAYYLGAFAVWWRGGVTSLLHYGPGNIAVGAGVLLAWVMVLNAVNRLSSALSTRRRPVAPAGPSEASRASSWQRPRAFLFGFLQPMAFEAASSPRDRLRAVASGFLGCLALGVFLTGLCLFVQAASVAWVSVASLLTTSQWTGRVPETAAMAIGFASLLVAQGFAMLVGFFVPVSAWPEGNRLTRSVLSQQRTMGLTNLWHVGYLLPRSARSTWLRRLAWFALIDTCLVVTGTAALLVVSHVAWAVGALPAFPPPGIILLTGSAVTLAGAGVFAYVPVLRQVAKVMQVGGCLTMILLYGGFVLSIPLIVVAVECHVPPYLGLAVCLPWLAVVLATSYRWCEPATWALAADGSPAPQTRTRALTCLLSLALSGAVAVLAFAAAMGTMVHE
jgi:hypothetical protein